MQDKTAVTKEILKDLVSYPVLPGQSNLALIHYIEEYLRARGIESQLVYSQDKTRANLFANIGPRTKGGIMLSGHTDVVSVEGQQWTHDPFLLVEKNNRLYGRGSVDMKGFLACCMACVTQWQQLALQYPIQLGITYDEESGGFGAKRLAKWLKHSDLKPACAIVGEPTQMSIIAGHKGGFEISTTITGIEAHSCNPENGVSAIHYAAEIISYILKKGEQLKQNGSRDSIFNPPYSTFNIGRINGGSSVNTIAGQCKFDWELRPMPEDDGEKILSDIEQYCKRELLVQMRRDFPFANIETDVKVNVPALSINRDSKLIKMITSLTGCDHYGVVAFGTDAGYFQNIGIDSVVFGPGSISQAHKPDEYIEVCEIEKCLDFLSRLHECIV